MNNEEKAQQLELAARIIREGLEWEMQHDGKGWDARQHTALGPESFAGRRAYRIRIKPTKEAPKRVPLGPEDVPPGSVFRYIENDDECAWQAPLEIDRKGACFHNGNGAVMWKDWAYLSNGYEIKRPGQDWMPCWKEAHP